MSFEDVHSLQLALAHPHRANPPRCGAPGWQHECADVETGRCVRGRALHVFVETLAGAQKGQECGEAAVEKGVKSLPGRISVGNCPDQLIAQTCGRSSPFHRSFAALCPFLPHRLAGLDVIRAPRPRTHYDLQTIRAYIRLDNSQGPIARGWRDGDEQRPVETVHVLKDITDRREAERRYRELFLTTFREEFTFSTPPGPALWKSTTHCSHSRIPGTRDESPFSWTFLRRSISTPQADGEELAEHLKRGGENGAITKKSCGARTDRPLHVFNELFCDARFQPATSCTPRPDARCLRPPPIATPSCRKNAISPAKSQSHPESDSRSPTLTRDQLCQPAAWSGLGFQQNQILGHPLPDLCAPRAARAPRSAGSRGPRPNSSR